MINEIHGLFTYNHLLFTTISLIIVGLLIFLSKNLNIEQSKKQIKIIGLIVIILEIIKIFYMIINKRSPNDFVPLYYCSLLIYLLIPIYLKNPKLQNIGYSLIMYYGLVPAIAFIFYPITAINFHPFISFDTIHSLIYHSLLLYLSLIIMIKKIHLTNIQDLKIYLLSTLSLCFIAYIVNAISGTYFMFINQAPLDNPVLLLLEDLVGVFYPIFVAIIQTLGSFIVSYCLYKYIQKKGD